jgi:glycosyltransferase involved in cell wall biosynthesis
MRTLSLFICTHDRAPLLGRTLEALNAAVRPAGWQVDILVIANACTDGTHALLDAYQREATRHGWLPLNWRAEPKPGKSNALNAGIPLLMAELTAMVDDDQRVSPDYLANLCRSAEAHADADMFCGRIEPDWDGGEPAWVHDTGPYRIYPLPVPRYDAGPDARQIDDRGPLPGGGNLIPRTTWLARVGPFATDFGPTGHDLGGAEDLEWVRRALAQGARILYDPSILQYHYVDPIRLRLGYLVRKAYERSASSIRLRQSVDKVPLFTYRKAVGYLAKAVFSASWRRMRFFLIRLAAALGEIKGYRQVARTSRARRA